MRWLMLLMMIPLAAGTSPEPPVAGAFTMEGAPIVGEWSEVIVVTTHNRVGGVPELRVPSWVEAQDTQRYDGSWRWLVRPTRAGDWYAEAAWTEAAVLCCLYVHSDDDSGHWSQTAAGVAPSWPIPVDATLDPEANGTARVTLRFGPVDGQHRAEVFGAANSPGELHFDASYEYVAWLEPQEHWQRVSITGGPVTIFEGDGRDRSFRATSFCEQYEARYVGGWEMRGPNPCPGSKDAPALAPVSFLVALLLAGRTKSRSRVGAAWSRPPASKSRCGKPRPRADA